MEFSIGFWFILNIKIFNASEIYICKPYELRKVTVSSPQHDPTVFWLLDFLLIWNAIFILY